MLLVPILISLLPVVMLFFLFLFLDVFRMVSYKYLVYCLVWGLASAGLSYVANTGLLNFFRMEFRDYSLLVSPWLEEILKLSFLWWMIKRNKVGFMIDGAIYGFAVGTAFALAENLYYIAVLSENGTIWAWIIRGFGTAVMHGGSAALMMILTMGAINRRNGLFWALIQGMIAALLVHAGYNFLLLSPLLASLGSLILVPVLILVTFSWNEKSIRKWMELEFSSEAEMIGMIMEGRFSQTKAGNYLLSLREHFAPDQVFDMYCFIRLYTELSLKAKSVLMLREADLKVVPDPSAAEKLRELDNLRTQIGRAAFLAITPLLRMDRKDLWKLSLLK